MNDLYGVDPEAPAGASELITLLRLFGPTEGRFIAGFPDEWISHVRTALEEEPQVNRERALTWLIRRRHAVLPTDRRFFANRPWGENISQIKDLVTGLVGTRDCPATLMPIDKFLYDVDSLADARGGHVPRNAAEYVKATWPLLAISPKVVLVDRYFRLRVSDGTGRPKVARQRKVLQELLAEAQRRRKVSVFCVQVDPKVALFGDPDGRQFEIDLQAVADAANATRVTLEYGLLDSATEGPQHGRYLLGAGCGIQFDHGFDTDNGGQSNHLHWLSSSEVQPLLWRFDLPDF